VIGVKNFEVHVGWVGGFLTSCQFHQISYPDVTGFSGILGPFLLLFKYHKKYTKSDEFMDAASFDVLSGLEGAFVEAMRSRLHRNLTPEEMRIAARYTELFITPHIALRILRWCNFMKRETEKEDKAKESV